MKLLLHTAALAAIAALVGACNPGADSTAPASAKNVHKPDSTYTGLRIAYVYGDSINDNYKFLIDAEDELAEERTRMESRMRRKMESAEARAQELQRKAPTMSQFEMQEAQLELQSLDLEMQQFQDKLASDFRKREAELQKEYINRVDSYIEAYNKEVGYDMILNYRFGGNLLYINRAYDITDDVLKGLNEAYDKEMSEKASAKPAK